MKDEAKKRLKRILGAYDEHLAELHRVAAARDAAKEAFPQLFAALRTAMLLPALEEIAAVMNASGHEASTHKEEESSSASGGVTSATATLRVIPKPFAPKATDTRKSFVEITFSAYRSERKVVVSCRNTLINAGGSVGKQGEYELEKLTSEVVVDHVLQTLEAALASK